MLMAVLLFGCVVKMSDWLLSEKDLSLAGGIAHICPVSEEDRMAAAKADLQMKTLPVSLCSSHATALGQS